jgi:hypothetical protein
VALLFYFILFYLSLFLQNAQGARKATPRGWWPYLILVDFYNTHQVLGGLPQVVGGLAILFNMI